MEKENEKFKVGDDVDCKVFHLSWKVDGSFEPYFLNWQGIILSIKDDKYEIWGPNGDQSTVVGIECLKKPYSRKTKS